MKCEICGLQSDICVKHHITSRCITKNEFSNNKVILCPNCHSLVHISEIILEGKFKSSSGKLELIWRYKGEESKLGLKEPEVYIEKRRKK
jgi:hypothetical protein